MAGAREIRTKIKSVANTRKVTRALEMVSASKIRKAQELMRASRPYAKAMRQVIGHIAKANSEFKHPILAGERAQIKRVGYIIVSTDRGLCGGLNSNMFRQILGEMREWQKKGVGIDVVVVGAKAKAFFRHLKVEVVGAETNLGERPKVEQIIGIVRLMIQAYIDGKVDRVTLAYNQFVNTMTQHATLEPLLPLPASKTLTSTHEWDYLYEPDAETVLRHVVTRYVESLVYQALVENLASEHAARMVAMKAASDNATKAIDSLTLIYNKARQAAITQEISEIVGGAAAV
jgi:F-type H+-transporting ATPase subunit gamma